jgi:hypothetical protein
MKKIGTLLAASAVAITALALTATSASARIVCNAEGDCWHVRDNYNYQPGFGLVVHEDNWRWNTNDHYRWREHRGRGYWRNGIWIRF